MLKSSGKVKAEPAKNAIDAELQWLIDRNDGAPNFELRKFRIKPGGSIPKHYHPEIEHEQYAIKGNYSVGIGDKQHKVKTGDALFIPAGTIHWYKNNSKEDAEFLCIIPRKENYDTVYLE
ncbi:MAG: cupin domain-containing protein [Thaumarchaeota archaeon]|nr:cupin domain-containing protein [Nitrososphaerota archaeon]